MLEMIMRLLHSSRRVLLASLMVMLIISCALSASAQGDKGSGEGWGSGRKTTQGKKSQEKDSESPETVETRLTRLFNICKSGKLEDAASFFVYRGENKDREWKDTLRADDPAEKSSLGELCRRIKGYLDESHGYSFDRVLIEREPEGEWHALEVSFQQGDKSKKVIFAFLLIKGQFAIGDIDNE